MLIKPKTWLKIKFNNNNSMLMVFCDREYEFEDYIENYKDLKKLLKEMNILIKDLVVILDHTFQKIFIKLRN